jgi:primary-amine oxidase
VPHMGDSPNTLMSTSASSVIFSPHNSHIRDRARTLTNGVHVEMVDGSKIPDVKFFGNAA